MYMYGFELKREEEIAELNSLVKVFEHTHSGATLIVVQNEDENKAFCVNFRTLPEDSTGVAHILEHAVLGGSRKYPVKEPFVEIVKGSLQTFVNALTFGDKTVYPVASTNLQDFYNLADVYLDAVFYPNITERTLAQEGWHYELEDMDAPLVYRGVVFNEMKGAYSSPEDVLGEYIEKSLFPDILYGLDSGGHPQHIPELTYAQFTDFHKTFYHPSNSLIWVYGDAPLESSLQLVNDYLKDFPKPVEMPDMLVPLQAQATETADFTYPYSVSADDGDSAKSFITVNWLLPEQTDVDFALACRIMARALVDTPASPLRKVLIESGLGEDVTGGGLQTWTRQMYFSTGLKGVVLENVGQVETLILDTLQDVVENGFDPDMIQAALNTIEFRLREQNTGGFPRGLALMFSAVNFWQYDADPLEAMAFEAPLAVVKEAYANNPRYFEELVQTLFLNNTHRTTVVLEPDPELADRMDAEEKERLVQARAQMSEADLQQIIEETAALKEWQNTPDSPEALATIPRLTLEDLETDNKTVPLEIEKMQDVEVVYHDLFTNGLLYLDLGFDLHTLSRKLLPYAGLFGRVLLQMGTATEDFVKFSQRIGRDTGGVYDSHFISNVRNSDAESTWLMLRGKATVEQTQALLSIMQDALLAVNLDNPDRFLQIVLEEKAGVEAHLVPAGHMVTYNRLKSHFTVEGWVSEQIQGIDYLFFLRKLATRIKEDWARVLSDLQKTQIALINRQVMLCNITIDAENYEENVKPLLEKFVKGLPTSEPTLYQWKVPKLADNEGLTIPTQVNYVGKAANLYDLGYELHGSVSAISKHLSLTHLWEKIRVMGGAYGAFNMFDASSGLLAFMSYRDPNVANTLNAYDSAADYLANLDLSDKELTGAIIGAISSLDQYQLPDAKGYSSLARHLVHYTDEMRQKHRDEVLNTSTQDFHQFADVLKAVAENGKVVVLGSENAINQANEEKGDDWISPKKVL